MCQVLKGSDEDARRATAVEEKQDQQCAGQQRFKKKTNKQNLLLFRPIWPIRRGQPHTG